MPQCFHPTRNLEVNISQMAFSDKGLLQKRERTHLPSPKNSSYLRTFDGQIQELFQTLQGAFGICLEYKHMLVHHPAATWPRV